MSVNGGLQIAILLAALTANSGNHFQLFLRGLNGDALIVSRRHVAGVRKMMQQL